MSGSSISSGIFTENEENNPEIKRIMNLKIKDLSIQIIPLKKDNYINFIRQIGQFFQLMIHPKIVSPTLSHIAIQLNMENDEEIIIMEYGQYFTSEKGEPNFFSSCDSSSNSYGEIKRHENNNIFWYINGDGLRIIKINNANFDNNKNNKSQIVSQIIATNHYGIGIDEFYEINSKLYFNYLFDCIDCNVENKITLTELCNYFKDDKWKAKNYNIIYNNCQDFAAKIIKLLKATRKNDYHKIRSFEKLCLPNCIISALWDNEKLSFINTMGRIPFIGLFYDLYRLKKIEKDNVPK